MSSMMRRSAKTLLPSLARAIESSDVQILGGAISTTLRPSPCFPVSLIRGFKSSSIFAQTTLSDVIRSEIEYETENYAQPEELAGGPPPPFTLTESLGDTLMTLTRSYGSDETVTVDVMVNEQPEEEPFESEEGVLDVDVGVVFTAQVARGEDSLVFECKSDGSYMSVMHVAFEPSDGDMEDSAYTGPVFEELDEELQRHFATYLEERGINPDLGGYLLRLVHDKEQREYMHWLEQVRGFLGTK